MDQSDQGGVGIFSRWTNQTQEATVSSDEHLVRSSFVFLAGCRRSVSGGLEKLSAGDLTDTWPTPVCACSCASLAVRGHLTNTWLTPDSHLVDTRLSVCFACA
eukprot:5728787-Pyramimonas_sp.AAC.1